MPPLPSMTFPYISKNCLKKAVLDGAKLNNSDDMAKFVVVMGNHAAGKEDIDIAGTVEIVTKDYCIY